MINKLLLFSLVTAFLLFFTAAPAAAISIDDGYIGGNPTNVSWIGNDVIGSEAYFQISRMEVTFATDGLTVDIYTRYLNNIGQYGTTPGDLFISTDGWHPEGPAPYNGDSFGKGEDWEYALVMDNHQPLLSSAENRTGSAYLYRITDPGSQIKLSWGRATDIYRANQEVQFIIPEGATPLAAGSWSVGNWGASDADDYLRFAIDYPLLDLSRYGFHWTMSCGNDVIEGGVHTPEPGTLFLFGFGLLGLIATAGRRAILIFVEGYIRR